MTTPADPSPGAFGKYELIDRLGRGGMADVWRARVAGPQGFARVLVLKRILPHLIEDKKARELFEREARVISRLSHANIVKVFEFGEINGEYYLTMEYVEGRDLAALIRAGGAQPGLAALVMRDVCRALGYAHGVRDEDGTPLRILHRDVSPSNVMIGNDGAVRLLDFGIAKAFNDPRDKRTVKGTIRGKFGYMAPEVIEGLEPDGRADLFAVGVVLHETLCGKRLFRGASDLETLALVKRAEIPLPSLMNPAVPPALDAICMRALERDRAKRFLSGEEMAEALDHVVHELRFGPTQLTDVMTQRFGADVQQTWLPEDSGPRTVREAPITSTGMGTARAVERSAPEDEEDRDNERATTKRPVVEVQKQTRELMPTQPKKPGAAGARVMSRAALPPVVAAPPAQGTKAQRGSAIYLAGGVLVGGLFTGALMLARSTEVAAPPKPVAVADLAQRLIIDAGAPDLASVQLLFPHDDEPTTPKPAARGEKK